MTRALTVSCFLFYFSVQISYCQSPEINYAHWVIDTLCSPTMNGRGYVDSGDYKAATFIRNEFQKDPLLSLGLNYFQPFGFDVNTFPGVVSLSVNENKLLPGRDFIVDAASGYIKGTYPVFMLQNENDSAAEAIQKYIGQLKNIHSHKVFIGWYKNDFTSEQHKQWMSTLIANNNFGIAGWIEFNSDKLTWDASTIQNQYAGLQLKDSLALKKKSKIKVVIESKPKFDYQSQNVIGYVRGTTLPDSFVIFTSHLDHLGQMGDGTYFPGANDNASGTSMVLNMAKYYSQHPSKYSVAFICFTGEELGLLGSIYFTEHPLVPLDKIKFLVNLDIVGTGDEGIKVVNATEFPKQFSALTKLNDEHRYLKTVSPRGSAPNSDHYPFYAKGVPCFFIYTMGGIAAYHDVYDRPETLPLTDYEDLFKLLTEFVNTF